MLLLSDARGQGTGVWCEDIERLSVPPVVLLGACGTARGPGRPGSGLAAHLGGAFLYAGAEAVVLSGDDLRYAPTLQFMAAMHANLSEGISVAEAARRARVTLSEDERWDGALHGAAIRVVGLASARPFPRRPSHPEREGERPRWAWWVASGGVALVLLLALRVRRSARA